MKLKDKIAIVTGAAGSGMGRSIALTLAREGVKVVVNYRASTESANAIVDHIKSHGGDATAVKADVFTSDGCKNLVNATLEQFGEVDICIINPGAGWHPEPIDKLNPDDAMEDVRQEIAPIFHLMPLVLPQMYKEKWGRVIAIALTPPYSSPAYPYNVGKAARVHALLQAYEQAWPNGVTFNVIGPGPVPAIETLTEAIEQSEHRTAWQKRTNTSPQDIAEGVTFLCSEEAKFVSGCVLPYRFYAQ
ncbi:MAG: SDR family NAD(P)-dependent oxidoreductase [Planctomycetota bacterium]|jgi:NAD(P)-dependent dehydrogenase (short-subunit alcohol dehydrogenase family)